MIVLASDHGGFELKQKLVDFVRTLGHETVIDVGCYTADATDYPAYARAAVEKIKNGHARFAIIVCGSGIGVSIAANRQKGIRAALCHNVEYAALARSHNDANVLCLGGRFLTLDQAKKIVKVFLDTKPLTDEKYARRNKMLDE